MNIYAENSPAAEDIAASMPYNKLFEISLKDIKYGTNMEFWMEKSGVICNVHSI